MADLTNKNNVIMTTYKLKTGGKDFVNALLFDEIPEHVKSLEPDEYYVDNGTIFSFHVTDILFTHENDECYTFLNKSGLQRFTPSDALITMADGELTLIDKELFILGAEKHIL